MAREKKKHQYSMKNGIRMTKSRTYEAAVYVGLSAELDKNGKPKPLYEWIVRDTYAECKAAKLELENEIKNGLYSNLRNMLFCVYSEKWIETISVAPTTRRDYKMYINRHFNPFFGRFKLKDIHQFHIKEYLSTKLKSLSPTTVRKHFYVLNLMLDDALKLKNPCIGIEPPKANDYMPYVPSNEEFELLRAAVKDTFDELIILLAGWCGLREGEIFGLKTDDILEDGIKIDESMAISEVESEKENYEGPKFEYIDKDPKSKHGNRIIVVPEELLDMLKVLAKSREESEKEKSKIISITDIKELNKEEKQNIRLFNMRPDSYSKRFAKIIQYHNEMFDIRKKFGQNALDNYLKFHSKNSIYKNIKLQNKKLPDIRFHDLRHYHTTVLYEAGIPDQYIAQRIGDHIKTMKYIYQHLRLERKNELDEKVKEIFK